MTANNPRLLYFTHTQFEPATRNWGVVMTKFLLGSTALAALLSVSAAQAADMPLKGPPRAAPVFTWNGCYIGGHAGWARAEHDLSTNAYGNINATARTAINNAGAASISGDGFIGGGQIGCNFHLTSTWVLGVEADFSATDLTSSRDTGEVVEPVSGRTVRSIDNVGVDWLATLRSRLGVAFGQTLIYVTGGGAIARVDASKNFSWDFADGCALLGTLNNCHIGSGRDTVFGWTAGGGIEWAITPQWSIKGEYLFVQLHNVYHVTTNNGPVVAGQFASHSVDTQLHIARAGLNFRF